MLAASAAINRSGRDQEVERNMNLTTTTNVSLDGVMQGLGRDDEDRRGGFVRGGWVIPLTGSEEMDHISGVYESAAAFLFGRQTYEIFARSWGAVPEMMASPIGVALNGRPKYVVSTSLKDPQWKGTSVLSGDVAAAIHNLKAQKDGDLVVPGSGVLVRWLLANGLIDQLDLLIYPVIVGQGTRLFADSGPDVGLALVSSRTTSRGITIQRYRTVGRPEYARSTAG
jgi:dihydrofolate reductase